MEKDEEIIRNVTFINLNRDFNEYFDSGDIIGKGNFGNVYKCTQKITHLDAVAKHLRWKRKKEKDMIINELKILHELRHTHILELYDAFLNKDFIIVTEYLAGGELFERITETDYLLTETECIEYIRQILEGVSYMHGKNILHLDLKTENIVCVSPESNNIKIIDFGLAMFYNPAVELKIMYGTPEFAAPETIGFDPVSYATDMWSIGVIAYILLSGLSPFLGENDNETFSNVTRADYDFEDEDFTDVSEEAKHFIDGLLMKNTNDRRSVDLCLSHEWLTQVEKEVIQLPLKTEKHRQYMKRRKWLKAKNVLSALNRVQISMN